MKYLVILCLMIASCSQKGYVYRDGSMQGVRYKKAVSPSEKKWAEIYVFVIVSILIAK